MRRLPLLLCLAAFPALAAETAPPPDPVERIRGLTDRWQSGELSAAEKDELLRTIADQLLRSKALESTAAPKAPTPGRSGDKIIAVYPDRNTTQLVVEARQPLVAGSLLYAGPEEIQITLDDLMARSGDLYYYSASTPGKPRIRENDAVVTQRARRMETPSALTLKIRETYTFENKRLGEVTAVQDGRAMIDRGTLHEVRERDIYKVFDSSGGYKGFLEIRGIGDLQSSGVLYNRMEDRRRLAPQTVPGDRAVFVGQRKLLALGAHVGGPIRTRTEYGTRENGAGGGLAWDLMFKNGWGVEVLFGSFERKISASQHIRDRATGAEDLEDLHFKVSYYAPVVIRKNFFFPSVVSPFLVAGVTIIEASLNFNELHDPPAGPPVSATTSQTTTTPAPVFGAGVDFFPARLIRPRLELRWIPGPDLHAGRKTLNTETTLASVSLFTAW